MIGKIPDNVYKSLKNLQQNQDFKQFVDHLENEYYTLRDELVDRTNPITQGYCQCLRYYLQAIGRADSHVRKISQREKIKNNISFGAQAEDLIRQYQTQYTNNEL